MKTTMDVLDFINNYAESHLEKAKNERNPTKSRERYIEYLGMKELINAVIDKINK